MVPVAETGRIRAIVLKCCVYSAFGSNFQTKLDSRQPHSLASLEEKVTNVFDISAIFLFRMESAEGYREFESLATKTPATSDAKRSVPSTCSRVRSNHEGYIT